MFLCIKQEFLQTQAVSFESLDKNKIYIQTALILEILRFELIWKFYWNVICIIINFLNARII